MITQETWGGFNLPILKVKKQTTMKELKFVQ